MRGSTLQLLVVGSFASAGLATHVFMARVRRPFLANLESSTGEVVRRMAITAEVLVLVAVVQVVSLQVLHRIAHNLEPWPQTMNEAE